MESDKYLENLIKINASLTAGALSHFASSGLQYVDVPQIVGITGACENVDTLFKVGNRLDLPLFFTQTGQLALEQALTFSKGVYTIIHSGRDEEEEDERHLRQFRLTEEEFDCRMAGMGRENYDEEKMFDALLSHIEAVIKSMIRRVLDDQEEILSGYYARSRESLSQVLDWPFLKVSYEEAVKLLKDNGYPVLSFGDDLKAHHEQEVVKLINANFGRKIHPLPVFITKYPKEIKFFNMKVSTKDPRVVLSSDLILPISGESAGSAVREHDGEKLKERLLTSNMFRLHKNRGGSYKDFSWYVDGLVSAEKTYPHAGFGVGNERVLQFILGLKDIRQASIFYLLGQLSGDWDRTRRGQIHLFSTHKKSILLSIGPTIDKKRLFSSIKQIYNNNTVLFATEKTHKFLKRNGVTTTLVNKISEEKEPNIKTLLEKGAFDIIVNILNNNKEAKENSDASYIRRAAIEQGTTLVTEVEVAKYLFAKLADVHLNGNGKSRKIPSLPLKADFSVGL